MSRMIQEADFDFDPFSTAVMSDPHPWYEVLRDKYPAYFIPKYDAWVFSRFEDVQAVLQHRTAITSTEGTVVAKEALLTHNAGAAPSASLDPLAPGERLESPFYEHMRQAQGAPLRPKSVLAIEDEVRGRARTLLRELLPKGKFDIVSDWAGVVVTGTMCLMYGIPIEEADSLRMLVNAAVEQDPVTGGLPADWRERWVDLYAVCIAAVERRREAGADGGLSVIDNLIHYRIDGRALSNQEIANQIVNVIIAGSESVPKILTHGLMLLQDDVDARSAILSDPATNMAIAYEEMIRFCGPAQWFLRTVRAPVTIAGASLLPGQRVIPLIQSANRDEREFPDGSAFVWNRGATRHVGFGHGQHFCVGNHLGRLEGRILLDEFLSHISAYRITDGVRTPSSNHWGFTSAIVHVDELTSRS